MSFWLFYWTAIGRAWHAAWHVGHVVHFLVVLVIWLFVVLGSHFGEHTLIWLPFVVLLLAFVGSVLHHVYRHYREEYDRRAVRERGLASEQGRAVRGRIEGLPENYREALRRLAIERRIGAADARTRFPGVDFTDLSARVGLLEHDLPPVDAWGVRPESLELLLDLLIPEPGPQPAAPADMPSLLVRLCRWSSGFRRVVEAAWNAAYAAMREERTRRYRK